jgi:hypothetical protein
MFYCFNGTFLLNTAGCQPISDTCELYNDIALLLTYSLVLAFLMLMFGPLTIRNIRQSQRRIAVPSIATMPLNQNAKKSTKQMTVMLLVQVVCSVFLSAPMSIDKIYTILSEHQIKPIE